MALGDLKKSQISKWSQTDGPDSQGQTVTEYIVLLSIIVTLFTGIFKVWIGPTYLKMTRNLTSSLEKKFLQVDLHYFPVGR